ncbi:MAG: hypothetical protein F7B06_00890 [Opitutae bacterium]|nr:hypothetical protein [Opitutae bacterium]
MVSEQLEPRLDLLREEYILVQAWKKTAPYIRYYNWYSDTLAIDHVAVNLPTFIGKLRERLQSAGKWKNDPLRLVPAPKSQDWRVKKGKDGKEDSWEPIGGPSSAMLRPLAHVGLEDQVVATAVMLCLADRVETLQGDPRQPIDNQESRREVVSYGNRLFCDAMDGKLCHRWGSAKLYRAYFQDYRMFLTRPKVTAESISDQDGKHVYVVYADLKQFYDRVRPDLLSEAINRVCSDDDDPAFFSLASSLLDWGWDTRDARTVGMYAKQAEIEDFSRVALPQGLAASGFFANVVLLPFDEAMRAAIGSELDSGLLLADACRYVDDLRVVIVIDSHSDWSSQDIEEIVTKWLSQILNDHGKGLALSPGKTRIAAIGGDERPLVRHSVKMNRIQSAVSGGFDALGGEEILDAIQGLMRAQEALSVDDENGWRFSPVADVRDDTVARFGAARFRITYRSIRPLLENDTPQKLKPGTGDPESAKRLRVTRTRRELDEDARAFALGLVGRWIADPANIRLLRIGLDLWPGVELLREVLSLLRPFTEKGGRRKEPRRVAWYCLSEVLRAGATETGLVPDAESLPSEIDLGAYREELLKEATRLVMLPGPTIPWYLRQQALLFLAACDPDRAPFARAGRGEETSHYRELILFLCGQELPLRSADFATLAVVARRAFVDRERAVKLTLPGLNPSRKRQIARRDPSFLLEVLKAESQVRFFDDLPARMRDDLCRTAENPDRDIETLADVVLGDHPTGPLRNELSLLRFAKAFLDQLVEQKSPPEVITPVQVGLKLKEDGGIADIEDLRILTSRANPSGSFYEVPSWCGLGGYWRFQLGFLLRFILSGQPDFTRFVRKANWKEIASTYRPAESNWYQRLYGLYSEQQAFGDDWLPITDWVEGFLLALLRWPGCRSPSEFGWVERGILVARTQINERIAYLEQRRGRATGALILPLRAKRQTALDSPRPLRACVVQTLVPGTEDFNNFGLTLDSVAIRGKHRKHLSAALAAVERMLELRKTQKESAALLDWLILPELAIHPKDVSTHLIPFARAHKTMILAGLTYEEIISGQPLVNSALWVIPEWSEAYGLQIRTRRQGKAHLAPSEQSLNAGGANVLQGFRPCQWLIGYPWSREDDAEPVWLSAAVCYDATDLGLAADLKNRSDVFAIPAFNKDVKTIDQMALALHYHMYQLVVVANNGQYGGSNAYWPQKKDHKRQVFHIHGQPQASIAFLEIKDIEAYLDRRNLAGKKADNWKHPPAG